MTLISRVLQHTHPLFLARHRFVVLQLARRDVLARYEGSILGLGWTLLYPLLILASYTFVFRTVFKARWPGGGDSTSEFILQMFAGLLVFNLFSELVSRAPRLIQEQPNLVKRVVFPLEVLSWVALVSAFFHVALGVGILLVAAAFMGPGLTPWALFTPLIFASAVPILLGLGWLLSALGVFIRDVGHAVGPAMTMLMFLAPVLYPSKSLPGSLSTVLLLNPLTVPIENLRLVVLAGQPPDWLALAVYTLIGLVFAALSHRLFERLRPAFSDEV